MTTEMDREVLIQKIEENRGRHEGQYSEAREAFWVKAQAFAEKTLERVTAKDEAFLDAALPTPPPCHLTDYDQALEMVRAHSGETVELDAQDFARLVLDQWGWSGDFRNSFTSLTG
jgi:hypothetical protein